MASRSPVAVYDACVLYPFHIRSILIQCAFDGLVEARWTDDTHAEWMCNLAANVPNLPIARFEATRDKMKAALPEATVTGYETLIPELSLPDPDDRHVLAAAIAGKASVIVTWNLKDFPAASLASHNLVALSPDDFPVSLHTTFSDMLIDSANRARQNLRMTIPPVEDFLAAIERQGLAAFAAILRRHAARLI